MNVTGSQIRAGNDITLDAARDVNLISAENTHSLEGKNESHGGSVGVGINFGSGSNGISVNASVNKGKGSETGNGTTHTETTIDAGNNLTIVSGRDTTLTGAQISGDKVTMDVGRDLTLTSERDSDQYDSKQQNASAGGSASMGGGSGSISLSQDKMHSNYDAVQEQTGIFAGKGGFDITVGEHTQLNGAVISSTSAPENNLLDTGTLGFSNIDNHAEYEVEHQSAGISSGGGYGDQFLGNMANGLLVGANGEGSADSTTKSAISDGTITIRDKDKQRQNVDDLSRDVANANPGLDVIFDKEKEQRRLQEIQAIGEIGSQAADVARTQGDLNGLKEAKKEHPDMTVDDLRKTPEYQAEMNQYGTGSALQQGLQAATAAIQGLAGGDMAKALAVGSAPYLAEVIKQTAPDEASRVLAHAVVAGALAAAQGNSAAAGAAGAAATALMGEAIKNALYGDTPVSQLSEEQKQTLVALGTAAAGLAGGLMGDSSASAMTGAQAGQNEISNNMAGMGMISQMMAQETLNAAALAESGKGSANDQAALALTKAVKAGLSASCLANEMCVLMAVVAAQSHTDAPANTGGDQIADLGPTNTGGDQQFDQYGNPTHTGNTDNSYTPLSNTGNTDGDNDTGGNTTTTPIAEQNKDDLAYLAGGYEPNKGAVGNMGEFLSQPGFGTNIKGNAQKSSQQYQGQSVYKATDDIGEYIKKGDQFYLDGQHKNHIEVFDKRGNFKAVLNLDGTINQPKTEDAKKRKL